MTGNFKLLRCCINDFLEYAVLTVCTRVDALLGYLADIQVDRNMTGYCYKRCGVLATKQYFFGSHVRD